MFYIQLDNNDTMLDMLLGQLGGSLPWLIVFFKGKKPS